MSSGGHDPLLSQEETDALLDAMRAGNEGAEQTADSIDLTSPERPIRAAMAHADEAAEGFVRAAPRTFLRMIGCSTTVEEEPSELTPWGVLSSALRPGTAVAILRSHGGCMALFAMGPELVSFILDRQMGAPLVADDGSGPSATHDDLSNVDRRVLRPVVEALVDTFSEQWCGERVFDVEEVLAKPADLPRLPQFEPLLRIALRAVPANAPGDEVLVALSSEAVLATSPNRESSEVTPTTEDRQRLANRIAATEIEVISHLGVARATIRELLVLGVGDVVRLDSIPGQSVHVRTGDIAVARGMPVVHHGNLAIEITETR